MIGNIGEGMGAGNNQEIPYENEMADGAFVQPLQQIPSIRDHGNLQDIDMHEVQELMRVNEMLLNGQQEHIEENLLNMNEVMGEDRAEEGMLGNRGVEGPLIEQVIIVSSEESSHQRSNGVVNLDSSEDIEVRVQIFLNKVAEEEMEENEMPSEENMEISMEINQDGNDGADGERNMVEKVEDELAEGHSISGSTGQKQKRNGKDIASEEEGHQGKKIRMTAIQYKKLFKPQRKLRNGAEASRKGKGKTKDQEEKEEEGQNGEAIRVPTTWRKPLVQSAESEPVMNVGRIGGIKRARSGLVGLKSLEMDESEHQKKRLKRIIQHRSLTDDNGVHPQDVAYNLGAMEEGKAGMQEIEENVAEEISYTACSARRIMNFVSPLLRFPWAEPNQPRQGP